MTPQECEQLRLDISAERGEIVTFKEIAEVGNMSAPLVTRGRTVNPVREEIVVTLRKIREMSKTKQKEESI